MKPLTIAIDFDGCVANYAQWPDIGTPRQDAKETINRLYNNGHYIIINSLRENKFQTQAEAFLLAHGFKYHAFNQNNPVGVQKYYESRKIGADVYIDDRQIGGMPEWSEIGRMVDNLTKPLIICIVGESGSGKTMIADYLESRYAIKMIQSRTTRSPRYEGENGHTFVSEAEFDTYKQKDMLAFTQFGEHRYCCLKCDLQHINTYVIDETGLLYLQKNFSKDYNIISIRIKRPFGRRLKHAGTERVERDRGQFTFSDAYYNYVLKNRYDQKEGVFSKVDEVMDSIFVMKPYYK